MRLKTTLVMLVTVILAILAFSGCAAEAPKKPTATKPLTVEKVEIEIKDFAFKPETVTIARKSRVTWINKDAGTHSVDGPDFSSSALGQGESYSYQFSKAGTFKYTCSLHPYMEGTIIVK